ncbi:phosphatidylglycerophosphatase A [Lactobacillus sp. ESL0731]|uniref:phosphatidylglycerophosphatase A family protein n=1 Tax=unclassified Lactobacillus TaxID=2620435 RepID=UPI0023F71E92|nr:MULTISPECIES: phosphatidylglycerophosphatase A [unclassified Lactobacillus]WEV51656.1 phosphatidylglycerophosphatase A [Lactobacillus sp. ESL0700]WEV62785.1 phosphatidylglycerophosphatase A [Lactobacillus sp. ESL0731]
MENRIKNHYPDTKAYNYILKEFDEKGIDLNIIAKEAYESQLRHHTKKDLSFYRKALDKVLHKREIMNYIMTGLALDNLATAKKLPQPLQSILDNDLGVYGTDESIAIGMTGLYGSIAQTNFGTLDTYKSGLAKEIDTDNSRVNVFLDDIVSALNACTQAQVAHSEA